MIEDRLHELPEGWVCTRLENCTEVLDRQRIPINAKERGKRIVNKAVSELYPYYGATGQVGWIDDYLFDEELILLGEDGAPFFDSTKNKAYIIKGKSWVNNHAHVLKALSSIALNQFLCHYLNIFDYRGYVTGTTRYKLNQLSMRNFPILLPSLPEQRAIVSKIEQLFSDLDNGIENFKKAQEQLKIYRQAVLKNACEGKLVPTEAELARAEERDYEPADVLLERILEERHEKWNGKGKYKEIAAPDTSELSELPEGWMWSIFGRVFNVYVGATPSRKRQDYWGGKISWVSSGEVAFSNISQTKETITDAGLSNSSTVVHPPGTVLLGMIGEGKTRGQAAILEIAACNNQNCAAIRVSEIELPPEYIFYFLEGEYENTRTIGSGNNQQALNKSRVQSMFFPLPPLAEQHRIVTEVERRLSICDKMEETISQSLQKAESLRQSILKKAFEGKLLNEKELEEVRNAPDWEPAEKLLERIKAEKTNTKAKKKGKK